MNRVLETEKGNFTILLCSRWKFAVVGNFHNYATLHRSNHHIQRCFTSIPLSIGKSCNPFGSYLFRLRPRVDMVSAILHIIHLALARHHNTIHADWLDLHLIWTLYVTFVSNSPPLFRMSLTYGRAIWDNLTNRLDKSAWQISAVLAPTVVYINFVVVGQMVNQFARLYHLYGVFILIPRQVY